MNVFIFDFSVIIAWRVEVETSSTMESSPEPLILYTNALTENNPNKSLERTGTRCVNPRVLRIMTIGVRVLKKSKTSPPLTPWSTIIEKVKCINDHRFPSTTSRTGSGIDSVNRPGNERKESTYVVRIGWKDTTR